MIFMLKYFAPAFAFKMIDESGDNSSHWREHIFQASQEAVGLSRSAGRYLLRPDHILFHIGSDARMKPLDCDQINLSAKEIFQVKG